MKLIDAFKTTAQRIKDYVDSKHVELDNAIETNGLGWTSEDETVHQIDSKYIPSSGGAMVVNFELTFDEETEEETITADKTVEEVLSAVKTSVVIGNFNIPDVTYVPLGICHLSDGRLGLMPVFGIIGQGQDGTLQDGTFKINFYGDEDGWHRNII